MTLHKHRSSLIPNVGYGGDGKLFLTDVEGTFPLRGGKTERPGLDAVEYQSFRSMDHKKRRYQPQQSKYAQEVANLGTWSSGNSSLARKLRKNRLSTDARSVDRSSTGYKKKKRGEPPKMARTHSLNKKKPQRANSVSEADLRKSSDQGGLSSISRDLFGTTVKNGKLPLIQEYPTRHRKMVEEKLPAIIFVIGGILLLLLGVAKLFVSWWHEYFCSLWTGLLVLMLGITGIVHKAQYLNRSRTGWYITFAVFSTIATMAACGITLFVLVPVVWSAAHKLPAESIVRSVTFSSFGTNTSLVSVFKLDLQMVVWTSLGLDLATLVLYLVNFFALTAAMMAISNHWDACYDTTGECDYRGKPRFFNPMEQTSVGQACIIMGLVSLALDNTSREHYWTPVWSGVVVIFAGTFSMCFGKRIDLKILGVYAIFIEILAIIACGGATVFSTFSMVDNITYIMNNSNTASALEWSRHMASAVGHGLFDLTMVVSIVFAIGVIFRIMRKVCCTCLDETGSDIDH